MKSKEEIKEYARQWYLNHVEHEQRMSREWREKNRSYKREYDRQAARAKRASTKGYKTKEYRLYCERNPQKVRAHQLLNYALRTGTTKRSLCEVCEASRVHAHHDDYSRPLSVRWLCPVHHKSVHVEPMKQAA